MPIHNAFPPNPPQTAAAQLKSQGLIVNIEIETPLRRAQYLSRIGQAVPKPQAGLALLDTGAFMCAVHEPILKARALRPIRQSLVQTPAGNVTQNMYYACLSFPGTPIPSKELPVMGCDLGEGNLIALIGRDVLSSCILIYNGPLGGYSLAF